MATLDTNETIQKTNTQAEAELHTQNFNIDRAMDNGYNKSKEEMEKTFTPMFKEMENVDFFDHKGRVAHLLENIKNDTPTKFVFNKNTIQKAFFDEGNVAGYTDIFARKHHIRNTLFAKSVERDSDRMYSSWQTDTSNHSVAVDNYDFFLKHNDEIRTNLARVMLAKLDLDLGHRKTLEDILNAKEWASASGDEVFKELKNRLKNTANMRNEEYQPIFRLLEESERIATEYQTYKNEKLKIQQGILENIKQKFDPFDNKIEDNTANSYLLEGIKSLKKHLLDSEEYLLKDALTSIIENQKIPKVEKIKASSILKTLSEYSQEMIQPVTNDVIEKIETSESAYQKFVSLHNESQNKAFTATEKVCFKANAYPKEILAYLTDKKWYMENIPKEKREAEEKEMDTLLNAQLSQIVPQGIKSSYLLERIRERCEISRFLTLR